jgi:hypothetical protein
MLEELVKQWRHTHAVEIRTQQSASGSYSSLEVPSSIRIQAAGNCFCRLTAGIREDRILVAATVSPSG